MQPPHRDLIAGIVDRQLLDRTGWDMPHELITLLWDGENIAFGTVAVIDTTIHPSMYSDVMMKLAHEAISDQVERSEPPTLYGFMLAVEAHAVATPKDDAPAAEHAQFQRDRLGRTFHQRPDAVEIASIWCVDVHRRMWTAMRRRPAPQVIEREFFPDVATPTGRVPGGTFVAGLRAAATAVAVALYGAPPPTGFLGSAARTPGVDVTRSPS
ncbi:hypothetical protein Ssi03_62250 [Sphaerisporangium siamense]|uniref:Uncharacterized protein n=1 Tax=Sphaerisporangium siamense TaxID=795645 RepID=A0A7W7GD12_9ACTN|nr:hypothetical protein [Sphaerisporangium siamense]MBB4702536.1 hypothetical protein [Sphaerisporangium siamense]GII88235.1 hypothetical protein Ssi03_62250 [Sphaerisporangium siamense]